jgi:DeoR/GlpR family transcriptional regulator of sugar metabolism
MTPFSRQAGITELLNTEGEQSVEALAERFGVSAMTIRRDLQSLAENGQVIRTHGGAAPSSRVSFEFRFLERARQSAGAKESIAAAAAELVHDGERLMLDSGTTTLALARRLRARSDLTVITTSLPIASELHATHHISILLLGGYLRNDSPDLIGGITERTLELLRADTAFLGADAVDANGEAFSSAVELARILELMAAACGRVYVVADSHKLGRNALIRFGHLAKFDGLITDAQAHPKTLNSLRDAGVNVIQPRDTENPQRGEIHERPERVYS